MRLYELVLNKKIRKGDKIYGNFLEAIDGSKYCKFYHLDGMYSYCVTEKGGVVHIRNGINVEIKNNKFFINL